MLLLMTLLLLDNEVILVATSSGEGGDGCSKLLVEIINAGEDGILLLLFYQWLLMRFGRHLRSLKPVTAGAG